MMDDSSRRMLSFPHMETLQELVDTGIQYEEQFSELYYKVLRDEGYMSFFGEHQEEAKNILTTLIQESEWHKTELENLKQSMT